MNSSLKKTRKLDAYKDNLLSGQDGNNFSNKRWALFVKYGFSPTLLQMIHL